MDKSDGWIGEPSQVEHFLRVIGADQDEEGKFKVYGGEDVIVQGLDGSIVVRGTAEYSVNGHRSNLVAGLRTTSYGLGIKVF